MRGMKPEGANAPSTPTVFLRKLESQLGNSLLSQAC